MTISLMMADGAKATYTFEMFHTVIDDAIARQIIEKGRTVNDLTVCDVAQEITGSTEPESHGMTEEGMNIIGSALRNKQK